MAVFGGTGGGIFDVANDAALLAALTCVMDITATAL
jgi:hypothetical protein